MCALLWASAWMPSPALAAVEYAVVDLGTLGGTSSEAWGVNDLGHAVGWAKDADGRTQAFLWQNGTMTGLGFLPGGTASVACAINNTGGITGYSYVSATNCHAFLHASNSFVDLGTLGGPSSWGRAINDHGAIAGSSQTNVSPNNNSFLWRSNQFLSFTSYQYPDGGHSCDAVGINEMDLLCGTTFIYASGPRWWGFVWSDANTNGTHDSGEMTVLGSLSSSFPISNAMDINETGQVVGWSTLIYGWYPQHAVMVTASNGQWKTPESSSTNLLMRDLGVLSPTNNSWANALNNRSWIVGTADMPSSTNQAFLWREGAMTNLNDLIDPASGWVLTNAVDISEQNIIVGSGLLGGQTRAFMLIGSPMLTVRGTNGATLSNGDPPDPSRGSDFGLVEFGLSVTNVCSLRNSGAAHLTLSNWSTNGPDASAFQFVGLPPAIEVGGVSNFMVVFSPSTARLYQASLSIDSDALVPQTNLLFAGTGILHAQAIDFPPIADLWATNLLVLSATASSGLPVEFAVASGPAQLADTTNLTFTGAGPVAIVASQPGDAYWAAATPVTNAFTVSKAPAWITLSALEQTYDGTARPVSATTDPPGLAIELTYDGQGDAPTNAGSYAVAATLAEALYEGSTNGLLLVAPADQAIDFPPIADQWITNSIGLSATASSGFDVQFAVAFGPAQLADATNLTFTGTGWVAIAASQPGDANWNPAPEITNTFVVRKMPAAVFLHDLAQTYDGTARAVSATTDPPGLAVELTYDGQGAAPTNTGSYAVAATLAEPHWEGSTNGLLVVSPADQAIDFPPIADQWTTNLLLLSATAASGFDVQFAVASGPAQISNLTSLTFTGTGQVAIAASQPGDANWNPAPEITNTFVVSKMPAGVFLHDLAQTYDGTARTVSATTDPPGLAVELTYDGQGAAPTNAGSYAVAATLAEPHWEGSTNGLLVVSPADQSIDFPPLPDPFITTTLVLTATSGSGLAVQFAVASGPAQLSDLTRLTFSNTGQVAIAASQPGDANWNPAPPVTNACSVWGLYTLSIASPHGVPDPPVGIHTHLLGTVLTNSIAVPEAANGTQLVCLGWTLLGHAPTSGPSTSFEMTLTNHATLAWRWTTNYWLETSSGPHGSVLPESSWQPAGLPAILTATPDAYHHFAHWTNSASGTNNPFALLMDLPKSAHALFAENLAAHQTPEWWLAAHGWTHDFDDAALRDDEPDGFPSWQEYVADTDPADSNSRPRVASILADGAHPPVITWPASTGRVYQIHRADDLPDGPWITQQLFLGAAEWTDTNPPPATRRFYRVAPLRP